MIDQKQLDNMEYFKFLGSMVTNAHAHVRLNPELPWKKHHPTRRLFLLLNWTYM